MFSSAVVLGDLNDFILPSQACIKPVEAPKPTGESAQVIVSNGNYYQVELDGSRREMETAKITLNDCLACSGCITSAEAVLVAMQSHEELLAVLKNNKEAKLVVNIPYYRMDSLILSS
jgi:iron only hydrogenase large subunit-like protein